jgi:hypothetical protein
MTSFPLSQRSRQLFCAFLGTVVSCLLTHCKPASQIATSVEQPPITEAQADAILSEWDSNPLTGRSDNARQQLKSYIDWHRERDSDPYAQLNARRLEWLKHYWAVWENPKLLDEEDGIYVYAEKERIGSGDDLRASELQAKLLGIYFGYAHGKPTSIKDFDNYLAAWDKEVDPNAVRAERNTEWVLRMRPQVLKERDEVLARYSAADGWKAKAEVVDAFYKAKRTEGSSLLAAHEKRKRNAFDQLMNSLTHGQSAIPKIPVGDDKLSSSEAEIEAEIVRLHQLLVQRRASNTPSTAPANSPSSTTHRVMIGDAIVMFPAVSGFAQMNGKSKELDVSIEKLAEGLKHKIRLLLGEETDLQAIEQGRFPRMKRTITLQQPMIADAEVPPAAFTALRQRLEILGKESSSSEVADILSRLSTTTTEALQDIPLLKGKAAMGTQQFLGIADSGEHSITYSMLAPGSFRSDEGLEVKVTQATTIVTMYVQHLILMVHVNAQYESVEDLRWTLRIAHFIREQLLGKRGQGAKN